MLKKQNMHSEYGSYYCAKPQFCAMIKLNIYISGKNRYNSRDFIAKTYRR